MRIGRPKEVTRNIGAPLNWDQNLDGNCGVLPVHDEVDVLSGSNTMNSHWYPDATELRLLNNGCPIELRIFGNIHPVVSLAIGEKYDEGQPAGSGSGGPLKRGAPGREP